MKRILAFFVTVLFCVFSSSCQAQAPQAPQPQQDWLKTTGDLGAVGSILRGYGVAYKQLPKDGPNLSWRVELIRDGNPRLYAKFHLDEPWDGPHNKELIKEIPSVPPFQAQGEKKGYTRFIGIVGEDAAFGPGNPRIPTANGELIMRHAVVLAKEARPWTQPGGVSPEKVQDGSALLWRDNNGVKQATVMTDLGDPQDFPEGQLSGSFVFNKALMPKPDLNTTHNLVMIGSLLRGYGAMHRQLPKDGPNLSWRVEVIKDWNPGVYAKFHFDEPWDGPHNKELIKEIPSFYQAQGEKEGYTRTVGIVGEDAAFGSGNPRVPTGPDDFTPRLAVVLVKEARPWTQPGGVSPKQVQDGSVLLWRDNDGIKQTTFLSDLGGVTDYDAKGQITGSFVFKKKSETPKPQPDAPKPQP